MGGIKDNYNYFDKCEVENIFIMSQIIDFLKILNLKLSEYPNLWNINLDVLFLPRILRHLYHEIKNLSYKIEINNYLKKKLQNMQIEIKMDPEDGYRFDRSVDIKNHFLLKNVPFSTERITMLMK